MDYWKKRRVRESAPALEHSAIFHVHTAFESPNTIKVNKREERTCRIAKNEPISRKNDGILSIAKNETGENSERICLQKLQNCEQIDREVNFTKPEG